MVRIEVSEGMASLEWPHIDRNTRLCVCILSGSRFVRCQVMDGRGALKQIEQGNRDKGQCVYSGDLMLTDRRAGRDRQLCFL